MRLSPILKIIFSNISSDLYFFGSDPLPGKTVHHKSQLNTKDVNFDLKLKRRSMHAVELKTVSSLKKAP